ncbi:MAG: hypothetical protein HKN04_09535 [Rhodothermaceae bacterium]|nr:hypothetical protein [Rhodothermaceae bacterium]
MHRIPRFAPLLTLLALVLALAPARAQDTPAVPDTIVIRTPENDARRLFNEGNELLRTEDFEGALAKFEGGLELDPTSTRNAYGRALALVQLDREEEATAAFAQAIELADAAEDAETGTAARRALGTIAFRNATAMLQANPLPAETAESALPLLEQAEAGGVDSGQLPYQFARVYNALDQHEDAARYAEQAVGANEGGDLSPYYIELGLARKETGDIAGARTAFEEAKSGSWGSWAEHYLRELDTMEASEGG